MKKILLLCAMLALIATGCTLAKQKETAKKITVDEAKVMATNFINNNLVAKGSEVTIKEVVEENGLYKTVVSMQNGQEVISYLSLDGKQFFPQVMDIAATEKQNTEKTAQADTATAQQETVVTKTAKPVVEVFVMSYCPYGTQIEKGIIPVAQTLGNKVDLKIKFCDYAMHGKVELDENLTQYCIQKNEPTKYLAYLQCFLSVADKSAACLAETKIDTKRLATCVKETDSTYKVTEKFNDKTTWSNGQFPGFEVEKADNTKYNVGGSPTLVVNGQTVSSGRDSASLLKTICSAFDKQPTECAKVLSSEAPAPGFGGGTTTGTSAGGCAI